MSLPQYHTLLMLLQKSKDCRLRKFAKRKFCVADSSRKIKLIHLRAWKNSVDMFGLGEHSL